MENSTTLPSPRPASARSASPLALWAGLIGGGVAWTIHFLFIYVAGEFGCISGFDERNMLGVSGVAWAIFAMTLAMLLVAGAATLWSHRRAQRLSAPPAGARTRWEFYMARAGTITSGLFCFIIVVETLPVLFYLRGC